MRATFFFRERNFLRSRNVDAIFEITKTGNKKWETNEQKNNFFWTFLRNGTA